MAAVAAVVFVVGAFVVGAVVFVVAAVSELALALAVMAVLVSLFSNWVAVGCSSKKFKLVYERKVSLHCRRGTSFGLIIMDKYKYIK